MPVYLVIFSSEYRYDGSGYAIKTIHRVVPTTLEALQAQLDKCQDLLYRTQQPHCQWELVNRPDNAHLEEMAELEVKAG